jgi:SAM-dependent methyltransferase
LSIQRSTPSDVGFYATFSRFNSYRDTERQAMDNANQQLRDPREIWEICFAGLDKDNVRHHYEPWLARWFPLLETSRVIPLLDLGCGSGFDSRYLTSEGFSVIGADYCRSALACVSEVAPRARRVQMDLRGDLPFPDAAFQVIVANLCLHYFSGAETRAIIEKIRRRLRIGGFLMARFNSKNDVHHGAIGHEEVEPGCYIVGGMLKHFFDSEDLKQLFSKSWIIHGLEEMTIHCYSKPKVVWELVAEKEGISPPVFPNS